MKHISEYLKDIEKDIFCLYCKNPKHKNVTECRYYGSGVCGNEI